MKYPRIYQAKAIEDHTVMIEFTNQEVKKYNIIHLFEDPRFAPLNQPAFFKKFKVENGGYEIVWNEDIDLSEYELWKNGIMVVKEDRSVAL
ncbi:DUF2442 domain-containing protein [Iningainema tapete]|uniref:DUF2442 domain-containing protein n=1 Tax=Iningainema tapete BLCC-T55 TaxID=2748662 RepID=A0A8J7BYG7_9CYAN|nr:DUF2442 domain-containing protein [Iningainema tapete]MBD2774078.1 DUF2442 domain-containing protein [Iningainema tapete BLCC-T55]